MLKWKINKLETDLRLEKLLDLKELPEGEGIDNPIVLRLEDNIKQLTASLAEKEQAMKSLVMLIDRFKGLDNQILKMKYIEGLTLKEIAEKLIYSHQHIVNLHPAFPGIYNEDFVENQYYQGFERFFRLILPRYNQYL